MTALEHFWKMRSAKSAPDISEGSVSHKTHEKLKGSEQPKNVRTVDGARTLVDSVRRSCYAGIQPVVTKHAQQSMSDAATLLASGIAAEGC